MGLFDHNHHYGCLETKAVIMGLYTDHSHHNGCLETKAVITGLYADHNPHYGCLETKAVIMNLYTPQSLSVSRGLDLTCWFPGAKGIAVGRWFLI